MKKTARSVKEVPLVHPPVLIIDPGDMMGSALYQELKKETLVVLVSSDQPEAADNLIFIPFKKLMPKLPGRVYAMVYYVWDGEKEMLQVLPEFLKKARSDKTPFALIIPYQHFQKAITEKAFSLYPQAYVFITGDLFGKDPAHKTQSPIDTYLYQAKTTGGIQVEGLGLHKLYPIGFNDTVPFILQTMTEKKLGGKIIHVFPKTAVTTLTVVRIMQKVDPLIHIDFLPEKKKRIAIAFIPVDDQWVVSDGYPLQEKLYEVYAAITVKREEKLVISKDRKHWMLSSTIISDPKEHPANTFLTGLSLFFLYATLIFLLVPFLSTITLAYFGMATLQSAKTAIEKGDLENANRNVSMSQALFSNAGYMANFLIPEALVVGRKTEGIKLADEIDTGKTLADTAGYTLESILAYKKVFYGASAFPTRDFLTATNALKDAIINYQMLGTSDTIPKSYKEKLASLGKPISLLSSMGDILPQLFAADGQKTYAVLFQNNMELRPMGGFIGSYGIVKVARGKVTDFSIHDVYDADGQLKGHVEPPFAIRRYIPIVHLFVRDSNFDVDFSQGAPLVATLLQAETHQKVDGVIGVDLSFVKAILSAVGPTEVPEYHETVTANNFFLLTETHSEKNFFAGSSQKKDFLRSLFLALQQKLSSSKQIPYTTLLNQVVQAVREKHILFAFSNPSLQSVFTVNNMSSSLRNLDSHAQDALQDFIGVNEANIGVNKVNYFLERSISEHATIDAVGIYSGEIAITYRNKTVNNTWPGGDYKNYLRVVLPKGALLTQVLLDGEEQTIVSAITDPLKYEKKGFIPPKGLEIEHYDENGRTIYGFLVMIPAGQTKSVKINYLLPEKIDFSKPIQKYLVDILKQPGTDTDPFAFSLSYPNSLRVINATAGLSNQNNTLSYVDYLRTDKHFEVDFAKE